MGYTVGISSGWWSIARDPILLGLAQKIGGFGAASGTAFNQVDLESPAEFFEPRLKQNVLRVQRELGVKTGMHAEIGTLAALESAERRIWEEAHKRLVETVKGASDLNMVYVNFHLSSTTILQFDEARIRPFGFQSQVVGPNGQPLGFWGDDSKAMKEYLTDSIFRRTDDSLRHEKPFKDRADAVFKKAREERVKETLRWLKEQEDYKQAPPERKKFMEDQYTRAAEKEAEQDTLQQTFHNRDFMYQCWKDTEFYKYILEAGEIDAYIAVGIYMKEKGDMLWASLLGGTSPIDAYYSRDFDVQLKFNAAVASRYIEGHLRNKDHPWNKRFLNGMSVLEWLRKTGLVIAIEIPEVGGGGGEGHEGLYRLFDPRHSQYLIRKIGMPQFNLCIDFEHMLSHKLDVGKIIDELPGDFGSLVSLFHLGEPKPYKGQAHIPIPLGSQAQEVL